MVKRLLASLLFFVTAGLLAAQDMPPLPPMNNDATVSSNSNTSAPALPPLPDQQAAPANSASPALPPLPDQQAAPASSASPALPPLPGQPETPAAPAASSAAPALPPVPGEAAPAAPAASAEPAAPAETVPATVTPVQKTPKQAWWTKTKKRANVIFGGWVSPKGGNESSRIAWTSQEVLNALLFKGYKVIKEDGKYDGQAGAGGNQWREFTFSVPKSKLTTQVYLKQVGKKVWLRVGPNEPPAFAKEENTVAHVKKIRDVNLKALRLVQKKLGRRLSPHRIIRSWEAPYSFAQEAVVE
jgi:hypothetical protein